MEKEYLSIKEFAALTGTTTQAVYKQLPTKLQPYCKLINKKKMLKYEALKEFDATYLQPSCKPITNQVANKLQAVANQENIENLREMVDLLKEQLQTKDKQLQTINESIEKQLNFKDMQLQTKDKQLADQQETVNKLIQLQHNNQVLMLEAKKPNLFKRLFHRKDNNINE